MDEKIIADLQTAGRRDVVTQLAAYEVALDASDLTPEQKDKNRHALWAVAGGAAKPYADPTMGMKIVGLQAVSAAGPELSEIAASLGAMLSA
jgi:hypothetical protein